METGFLCIPLYSVLAIHTDVAKGGGVARLAKATPNPSKNIRQKQLILFTTFTLHIKLHSELQWRRNALNVL